MLLLRGSLLVGAMTAIGIFSVPVASAQEQAAADGAATAGPATGEAATGPAVDGAGAGADTTAGTEAPEVAPAPSPEPLRLVEARAQFTAGQAAFDSGAWGPALAAFERAHALTGSPELLYNIAITSERLGRLEHAIDRYQAYVQALPDATDRAAVDSRLRTLRAQLALRRSADQATARRERERARQRELLARGARHEASGGGGLLSQWWFWAAVGTVATAATVSTFLVLQQDGPAAIPGSGGVVHSALMVAP